MKDSSWNCFDSFFISTQPWHRSRVIDVMTEDIRLIVSEVLQRTSRRWGPIIWVGPNVDWLPNILDHLCIHFRLPGLLSLYFKFIRKLTKTIFECWYRWLVSGLLIFAADQCHWGDTVALLIGHWTCDLQVTGSSPGWVPLHSSLGQATYTCVPLSPSSIIWYRLRGWSLWLGK